MGLRFGRLGYICYFIGASIILTMLVGGSGIVMRSVSSFLMLEVSSIMGLELLVCV